MAFVITPEDWASFRRCRRQWDFGSRVRRNLAPAQPAAGPEVKRAIRDALDIYYFPGMWDWDRAVTLPLVIQGFKRAMAKQREQCGASADEEPWPQLLEAGQRLLGRYMEWAPTVDGFSPVIVAPEYEATVLDPARPEVALVTPAGASIRYRGRIDMLAVDASDTYWIVRHRAVTGDWAATEELLDDEEAAAECWAWEHFYPGMTITGVIYNEFRLAPDGASAVHSSPGAVRETPGIVASPVRQNEPSGGGRSVPQHRRMYAVANEPEQVERVVQHTGNGFRRTLVRRSPEEITSAWCQLAADASMMIAPDLTPEPTASDVNCPPCPFREPCRAMFTGEDVEAIVRSAYRERPPATVEEERISGGSGAWGGRGATLPGSGVPQAPRQRDADRDH